jgi:hypothetical protein
MVSTESRWKNGQKMTEMDRIWKENEKNGRKCKEMDRNGQKRTRNIQE